jgi:hypothetical protein
MGASFAQFLHTGQLGPLTLGMSPASVEVQLGEPEARSRKLSPLILKYGPLELTFWSHRGQAPQLAQISLSLSHGLQKLPSALLFNEWTIDARMRMESFERFVEQIGARPEDILRGDGQSEIIMPSGVRASFLHDYLVGLQLSAREGDKSRPPNLSDEREPSVEQLRSQLREALFALSSGLASAAVLLAWAALEAVLRRTALDAGYEGKVRVQPTVLIRELFSLGRLTRKEVAMLESARQQRTMIAHGLVSDPVNEEVVLQIVRFADRLLNAHVGETAR